MFQGLFQTQTSIESKLISGDETVDFMRGLTLDSLDVYVWDNLYKHNAESRQLYVIIVETNLSQICHVFRTLIVQHP